MFKKWRDKWRALPEPARKKFLLIAGAYAVVIVFLLYEANRYSKSDGFCGSCHEMEEHYERYYQSEHNLYGDANYDPVGCADCHIAPGLRGEFFAKRSGLRDLYYHLRGGVDPDAIEALESSRAIIDENCVTCHFETLGKYALEKDHEKEFRKKEKKPEKRYRCIDCHDNTGHDFKKKKSGLK